jgi:hypothetical protein
MFEEAEEAAEAEEAEEVEEVEEAEEVEEVEEEAEEEEATSALVKEIFEPVDDVALAPCWRWILTVSSNLDRFMPKTSTTSATT